ncbi:M23 family metallopeptidase [Ectothiorhodospiraceae bacterium BW-2]|nr:M23 family metallopeptidase [Ectothiorhodospiraceae bacterium BW-2]
MNIIIVSRSIGTRSLALSPVAWGVLTLLLLALPFTFGLMLAQGLAQPQVVGVEPTIIAELQQSLNEQRQLVTHLREEAQQRLEVVALRLGRLQAQIGRLDAMGYQLVDIAALNRDEFDFTTPPAIGGPHTDLLTQRELPLSDLLGQMAKLEWLLEDRGRKLEMLQLTLQQQQVSELTLPSGRPLKGGYLSSRYGYRTDPFTGKPDFHHGIDLAAEEGSEIMAVASGVVTWAGERSGYGYLVEIAHGNGYVTRYGHNRDNRVKTGDVVNRGETIATVGSTGRSTGPHLHFEVVKGGRSQNPLQFMTAAN